MGIRSAARSQSDDTLTPRDIIIAKALIAVHGATVVFGLAAGGRFLILAAFGAVMATVIGVVLFYRPRTRQATASPELQSEP